MIQREKERERIRGALFLPWIPSLKENVFSVFGWKRCTESQLFRRREKVAPVASGFLALGELRHFPSRAAKKVPFRLKTKPFNRFHRFSKYCEIRKKGTSQRFILPFLPFSRSPFVLPPIHVYRRVKGIHFSWSRTGEKKNPLLSNWIIFHRFFGKFIYFPAKPDQNRINALRLSLANPSPTSSNNTSILADSARLDNFQYPDDDLKAGAMESSTAWSIFRASQLRIPSSFSLPCSHVGQESASFLFRATRIITRNDAKSGFRGKKRKKNNNFFFLSLFHGPSLMITGSSLKKREREKLHPSRHARGMVIIKVYIPRARSSRFVAPPINVCLFIAELSRGVFATQDRDA